jgi:hypothetical protein
VTEGGKPAIKANALGQSVLRGIQRLYDATGTGQAVFGIARVPA